MLAILNDPGYSPPVAPRFPMPGKFVEPWGGKVAGDLGDSYIGVPRYAIDELVVDGDMVAVAWTGTLPSDATMRGLSLYNAAGGLLRSTQHTLIGDLPA